MTAPVIVWFRQDLRLADNPALAAAVDAGAPVVPVYIHDTKAPGDWKRGGASLWWLHHSLAALAADLEARGSRLVLREGPAERVLERLIDETGAGMLLWNRLYEPWAVARDTAIKSAIAARGLRVESFNAGLLFEPWTIKTGGGKTGGGPYRVFTPFWKTCLAAPAPAVPRAESDDSAEPLAGERRAGRLGAAAGQTRLGGRSARRLAAGRGGRARPARRFPQGRARRLR